MAANILKAEVMESAWQRLQWSTQIEDLHIHDLRHTIGTYAAQAGCLNSSFAIS
jgi:integrase